MREFAWGQRAGGLQEDRRSARIAAIVLAAGLSATSPGFAEAAADPAVPSGTAVIKLIELLIQNGVLTRAQADALIRQAKAEAEAAGQAGTGAAAGAGVVQAPDVAPGTVRVPYVPETVKKQIKEELRQEVALQAKEEGWAEPGSVPEWIRRIKISGDVRGRYEEIFQDPDNAAFTDFQENNESGGFDIGGEELTPLLNTTRDRTRYRLRARLGVDADIDDWVSAGVRVATGSSRDPVSTNQTLGSPGNFAKYDIWLDRAFIKMAPVEWGKGWIGRMPNPFWTTDLLFDTDLNFDGIALQFDPDLDENTSLFFNTGAFPVFNTAFDFSTGSIEAESSRDKYLLALQAGLDHKISKDYAVRGAVGYYYFDDIQGEASDPCNLDESSGCDTDLSIPQFVQRGNTLFGVRNFQPGTPEFQVFGLASEFGILDLYGRFDMSRYDPIHVTLEGNFLKNLLFDHGDIQSKNPATNLSGEDVEFDGGDMGFMVRLTVGHQNIDELWDWNVSFGYKYLESDAVVDGFADSDFHLGGTNAKGYILGGNLGVARNTFLSLRWLSAEEVSGPPLANDVLQFDLVTSF